MMVKPSARKTHFQGAATVIRVIDGDTFEAEIDLGFKISATVKVRLAEVDAPEINTGAGISAASFLSSLLPAGRLVQVMSHRLDQYGRSEATVLLSSPDKPLGPYENLSNLMAKSGHAHETDRHGAPKSG